MEEYNAACVAGVPDEFGRTYFEETAPIVEGPFYASPGTWAVLITVDGLTVDERFRVLDDGGQPIAGLLPSGRCVVSPASRFWGTEMLLQRVF